MKYVFTVGIAVAAMLASFATRAQSITCGDVIASADRESMAQSVQELRTVAFQISAKQHAVTLYKALEDQGIRDPLFAVLDQYETTFVPVRAGSEATFTHLVSTNGGLKATISKLCPQRETDLLTFYAQFYDSVLQRYTRAAGGGSE